MYSLMAQIIRVFLRSPLALILITNRIAAMNKNIFNIPNLMTCYRIPAGLLVLWLVERMNPVIYPDGKYPAWIIITIMILSVFVFLTDVYDGKIARRYNIVTDFGKMMDPIADSLFFTLLLLGLTVSARFNVSVWFAVLMIYREAGVQIIRRVAALKGVVLMAGWAGKLKMVVQGIATAILGFTVLINDCGIYAISENILRWCAWSAAAITAMVGILSLITYIKQLPVMINEQKNN